VIEGIDPRISWGENAVIIKDSGADVVDLRGRGWS
jgi:hypothetical protein